MRKKVPFLLILLATILSVFYLLYYFQFKYYWHDEVLNLLAISGYNQETLLQKLYDGAIKTQTDLFQFQSLNNNKNLGDTINHLISTSNYELPLYYIILWTWAKIWGNHELVFRSLSIVIWLAFLFYVYQLSFLLFNQKSTAVISTILTWLSTRFFNYALEVWEYGLYALITALSSFLFLKALNSQKSLSYWIFYCLSLIAGLYTHVFFMFVTITHLIYFIFNRRLILLANQKYYFFSLITALLIYYPWLQIGLNNNISIYKWTRGRYDLITFIKIWINSITSIFYPFQLTNWLEVVLSDILFLSIILAFIYLIKKAKKTTWSFLIFMIIIPFLSLILCDVFLKTRYSSVGRFYLPTLLSIILTLAFLISEGILANNYKIKLGSYFCLGILICLGVVSKIPTSQAGLYQGYGSTLLNASSIVNKASNPLVISEFWLDTLTFNHKTKENTHYLLINHLNEIKNLDKLQNTYTNVYILKPSELLCKELVMAGVKLVKTQNQNLWQIK